MSPMPDGVTETRAERHYAKCRGPLGFHFLTGCTNASPHKVTRELARALWRLHCDVTVEAELGNAKGWPRTSIRHLEGQVRPPFASVGWTRTFHHDFQGQARIEVDAIDTLRWADPRDIRYINERVDLLLVPGQDSKDAFVDAGVRIPVEVITFGFDPVVFRDWGPDPDMLKLATWPGRERVPGKTFLTGGYIQERKGLVDCIESFRLALDQGLEGSLLVLMNRDAHGKDLIDLVTEKAQDLPIGLLHGGLDEWALARLYSSVDCYVSCHHVEGFGLMPVEARACGADVILTGFSGPLTYEDADMLWVEPKSVQKAIVTKGGAIIREDIFDACEDDVAGEISVAEIDREAVALKMLACGRHGVDANLPRWEDAAVSFLHAVGKHVGHERNRGNGHSTAMPYQIGTEQFLADNEMGDVGHLIAGGDWADDVVSRLWVQREAQVPGVAPRYSIDGSLVVFDATDLTWTDPLKSLGLTGAPFEAILLPADISWLAWTGAYYPRGLGILDVVLWAKSHGIPVIRASASSTVCGPPPWWEGASGEAEAAERLAAHLDELNFWWSDLLDHIRKTGWW